MEVTTLCFRLYVAFLHIAPNRQQHFEYESVTFHCEGFNDSTQLRGIRNAKEFNPLCAIKGTSAGSFCTFDQIYAADSGEYWCETGGGQRSNSVNITVTDGSVILDSPVLPVMEGHTVTLHCRNKTIPNIGAEFYKDDVLVEKSPAGKMIIHRASLSDEGLYKCSIPLVGASPGSWLAIRASSVVLKSPVLPVMKGDDVMLSCRKRENSSSITADFFKDGHLIRSSSTGEMSIHSVSKSDEGLYKCNISGAGHSLESWLAVRESCAFSDDFAVALFLLRTILTILMFPLLLLLVGLLHCGKLRDRHQ
ncbi:Fc receptor-like protein 5 [Acanthopagrus schlegelii]